MLPSTSYDVSTTVTSQNNGPSSSQVECLPSKQKTHPYSQSKTRIRPWHSQQTSNPLEKIPTSRSARSETESNFFSWSSSGLRKPSESLTQSPKTSIPKRKLETLRRNARLKRPVESGSVGFSKLKNIVYQPSQSLARKHDNLEGITEPFEIKKEESDQQIKKEKSDQQILYEEVRKKMLRRFVEDRKKRDATFKPIKVAQTRKLSHPRKQSKIMDDVKKLKSTGTEQQRRDEALNKPVSVDSIGFVLLEKMGYKPGTSLGKGDDGILEPISLEIKTTRTGLGHDTEMKEIEKTKRKQDEKRRYLDIGPKPKESKEEKIKRRRFERRKRQKLTAQERRKFELEEELRKLEIEKEQLKKGNKPKEQNHKYAQSQLLT
uniref:G-patch domain-containing protein n=1 Tax=Acrobeloides nanus TaxID=290746 RepID=A0A914CIC5_9BILA